MALDAWLIEVKKEAQLCEKLPSGKTKRQAYIDQYRFDLTPDRKAPFLVQDANSAWLKMYERKSDSLHLIGYRDLESYMNVTGDDLDEHDIHAIMEIDRVWTDELRRQEQLYRDRAARVKSGR